MESILNTILGTTAAHPNTRIHRHSCNCGCAACQKSGSENSDAAQSDLNEELGWRQGTFFDEIEAMQFEASDGSDLVQIGGVAFAPLPRQDTKFYWPLVSKDPKNKLITYRKSNSEIRKYGGRAFLDKRSGYRHHMAVDLYAREGDPVIACEDGVIRSFYHFYRGVYALFVDHGHVVINYGEVAANSLKRCFGSSSVGVGSLNIPVKAGQTIAYVGKMYHSSMLHFEMYRPGTVKNERWCWKSGGSCKKGDTVGLTPPAKILNPTRYLFHLKNYGQVVTGGGSTLKSSNASLAGEYLSEEFWGFPDIRPALTLQQIMQAAAQSKIATHRWKDRGKAPIGYLKGMALVYARVYKKLLDGDAAALEMAKANTGNALKDALAHYAPEFNRLGMNNDTAGVNTLRHLFVLMMGLGMRESGGKWCVGRDRSARNTKAETAEAGLFQTSYNAKSASPILPQLFQTYVADPRGFLEVFQEGVKCRSYDLENFGTGNGKTYQELSKKCPAFAVEFTAVALRNRRKHWGPINRKNVELLPECDRLLLQVQKIIDTSPVLL